MKPVKRATEYENVQQAIQTHIPNYSPAEREQNDEDEGLRGRLLGTQLANRRVAKFAQSINGKGAAEPKKKVSPK